MQVVFERSWHLQDAAEGKARETDVEKALLFHARVLAACGGLFALAVQEIVKTNYSSNVQLRAAIEQTNRCIFQATFKETSKETFGSVDCIAGLVDLVTAAEVEVRATGVTSLADSDITGDGRDTGVGRAAELGSSEGAEGHGKSGNDGELHLD